MARRILVSRASRAHDEAQGTRRAGEEKHRHGFTELSPARRSDRAGEHRSPALLQRHPAPRSAKLGRRHARSFPDRRQERSLPQPALRRTTATRRRRASCHSQARVAARRRADRQSAFQPRQGDHGTLPRIESAGNDDCASDALRSQCSLRKSHHPVARRLACRRYNKSRFAKDRHNRRGGESMKIRFCRIPGERTPGEIVRIAASLVLVATLCSAQVQTPADLRMPQSHNPIAPYMSDQVPEPVLTNSQRLDRLVHDGKLYLSLKDAIDLALENNLDLAIARYNLPIADTDVLRTKAGASFRGVNTGVVQGTPGGGVGGFGTGAPGAGAGGTTSGAGGAGAGASGLVQSTLGVGAPVNSYDPQLNVNGGVEHLTLPQSNKATYGISPLQLNTTQVNANLTQSFSSGTTISFMFDNSRQTTNSPDFTLSPALNSYYRFTIQQELLAGFGFGPNLRYIRIANNNKRISDIAFKDQVIATVTQIENIYWDLVSAYEQARVNEQSLDFANQTLDNAKKQLQLESIPQMDVMKAEAEVSQRDQDLTVARTNLELQESLIKNALTKSLDDPTLQELPVVPTDRMQETDTNPVVEPLADLITEGLKNRPELLETDIDLVNRQIR